MKTRGFTLLELLIVIAIIGVLVGIGLPALLAAKRSSKEKAALVDIKNITIGIDSYNTKYGDYPPTSGWLKGLNDTNLGNESLVWHLFNTKGGGPYLDISTWENKLANSDADSGAKPNPDSIIQKADLQELVDEFGNPFVYFHHRDFTKPDKMSKYMTKFGEAVCKPGKSDKTGNFHAAGKYQIWSFGSDDANADGGDGDISTWKH